MRAIGRFLTAEEAASSVEYAVLLALILLAVFGSIGAVGGQAGGMWGGIESNLSAFGLGK